MTVSQVAPHATKGDPFLAGVDAFQAQAGGLPDRLAGLRHEARERYAELGLPTTRLEAWRFTNVAPIARRSFTLAEDFEGVTPAAIERYRYPECVQIALVNGRFSAELSDLEGLPEGVEVMGLAEALELEPEEVDLHLGRYAGFDDKHFVALNTAFLRDGVYIRVPRGVVVERPVNVLMIGKPGSDATDTVAFFPRTLIVAEESSQLSLVEQYVSVGEGAYLSVPVTEVVVGANAVVDHYKLERESLDAYQLATLAVRQDRDSNFSSHSISWGGAIVRNDVHAILDGEGCESTLNGLYMVEHEQLVDNSMRVEHAKPHCVSHELYKGILEGRARAVFTGRIFVHEGAQKTDAKQTNRNLLLSPTALCNSQPQLEIFADDVRCTHGSTVGQLDETAVFYLRSRGIGEEAAKSLLTYAFASDVVGRVKIDSVRHDLEEFLFRRLPKGDIVRQAV
jgi:Fe-S cluster assembly protein SufD